MNSKLYNYINGIVRNVAVAEDLYQNVQVKSFSRGISGSAYLYTVAKFECYTYLSNRKFNFDITALDLQTQTIEFDETRKYINLLPPKSKEILNLVYYNSYNYKEISEILKIKEGAARMRAYTARKRLKKLMK